MNKEHRVKKSNLSRLIAALNQRNLKHSVRCTGSLSHSANNGLDSPLVNEILTPNHVAITIPNLSGTKLHKLLIAVCGKENIGR